MLKRFMVLTRILTLVIVLLLIIIGQYSSNLLAAKAIGTVYYVDSSEGNDNNDGISINGAWKTLDKVNSIQFKPGDKVLFRAGGSWKGMLNPKGSGSPERCISIDMYGEGSKPLIYGDGSVDSCVKLRNQSYWEISNLEITNKSDKPGDYRGISVEGIDSGTLEHIYIKNCYIHDVAGELKGFKTNNTGYELGKRTGGIVFWTDSEKGLKTKFNDILIQNNKIKFCSFGGIIFKQTNKYHWALREGGINDPNWYPHTNITIKDNYFNQDTENSCVAILLTSVKKAVINNNMVYKPGQAGIEVNYVKDCLVENNEVYGSSLKGGGIDYCGLDFDRCTDNTTWQYNYINNCGTGILICHAVDSWDFGENNIVRYNIFQNYKKYGVQIFAKGGPDYIYNNVFYNDKYDDAVVISNNDVENYYLQIKNNIFYQTTPGGTFGKNPTFTYNNNLYYGSGLGSLPEDENKVTLDPKFVAPGKGGIGNASGPAFRTLKGYELLPDSPFGEIWTSDFNKKWSSHFNQIRTLGNADNAQYKNPDTEIIDTNKKVTLGAVETAYIRSGSYADTNYAKTTSLVIKNAKQSLDDKRIAYLKFDLSNLDMEVGRIKLAFTTENSYGNTLYVYGLADSNWEEADITWNNAPNNDVSNYGLTGSGIMDLGTLTNNAAQTYEIDVTDYVNNYSNGLCTFVILSDTIDEEYSDNITSKEGKNTPSLIFN